MQTITGNIAISKEFHWEMGHRLPFHDGACRNLHGHSYRMIVELQGQLDNNGMVLDYFDLKKAVAPLIDTLDHSFMVDESDDLLCQFFDTNSDLKQVRVPFSSTAENIAVWIASSLAEQFTPYERIHSITVTVCETRTSTATITVVVPHSK